MRALGLHSKIVTACGAAAGLVGALRLPWYGPAPANAAEYRTGDVSGPLDGLFAAIPRWLTDPSGTSGWELAGTWGTTLAATAGIAILAALLCLAPAVEHAARGLLRLAALALLGVVLVKFFGRPPGVEPRHGLFAALALALLLVVTAQGVAACHLRRRAAPLRRYAGPAPRPPFEQRASVAPPSRISPSARTLPGAGTAGAWDDEAGMRRM